MILYLITSLSHILYFFVWDYTDNFINLSRYLHITPLLLIKYLSYLQKILQISLLINYTIQNNTLIPYLININPVNFSAIIIGQILNFSVYYKLGTKGVYYGNKFGYSLPYIKSFPYNIGIKDPQYTGCILTICGLYPAIPAQYIIYASSLYHITIYIESR